SKGDIIQMLFNERWDENRRQLRRSDVSLADVADAIRLYNEQHSDDRVSDRNPANFFKDLTRHRARANAIWPTEVFQRGFTGRALVGGGQCFQFVAIAQGQSEPFPENIPGPTPATRVHPITSAVVPLASRR